MSLTIIICTCIVSAIALRNDFWRRKLLLTPYDVAHHKHWYRMLTHGFIHADYVHLAVNMLVLYSFGASVEHHFQVRLHLGLYYSELFYVIFYFGGIIVASLSTLVKQKDNPHYASLGASGAVSAIIFAFIFFEPWSKIYLLAIVPLPAALFGGLYLLYTSYMARRGEGNVNHEAHFYGAVYGFLIALFLSI
ncbi:MAG: rhomboid family intramembrane serine protease [Bacteroidales bacterium]